MDLGAEQMVYAEATMALPLVAGYAYHKGGWKNRTARNFADVLDKPKQLEPAAETPREMAAVVS